MTAEEEIRSVLDWALLGEYCRLLDIMGVGLTRFAGIL
jgi:hypothetical protein